MTLIVYATSKLKVSDLFNNVEQVMLLSTLLLMVECLGCINMHDNLFSWLCDSKLCKIHIEVIIVVVIGCGVLRKHLMQHWLLILMKEVVVITKQHAGMGGCDMTTLVCLA